MKALMMRGAGDAFVTDVSKPVALPGEVLLRVRMVGMCGSDLNTFRGMNPMVTYPRILGHEVAGTVEDANGSSFKVGENVTLSPYTNCGTCASCLVGRPNACERNQTLGVQRDGAMTEFLSVPASKLFAAKLPIRQLALVEPLTVGAHAVSRGQVSARDTVAVFGCGGVGLGAIAGAAFRGANVIAIDVDNEKLQIASSFGATHLINTREAVLHDRLQELTNQLGPDVVIEAIGLPQTFAAATVEVGFSGRVVYIGYAKEPVVYETKLFVQKELTILGSRNALPEDFHEVIQMLEAGQFPVENAISIVGSIDDAPDLLHKWNAEPGRFTKILVDLD
ncbi:zinc-binding alcohol dehydrogenase family protein [Granulicella sibirica]|uniref:Alcohol dehydrogenase n=1 Tax=Granulicella sibirica TaxID=2479048 RepID=A0A4Q0SYP3_9BACT|nr:zinc-binding alcohol dehydrogenase family protein [Granulicella sibirica]RXH54156.1 alcohol dehydrogenase [Granulicella sibirica]